MNLRWGRSQTTLTSFWPFLTTYPLRWHFLPYKRWQKRDISGLPPLVNVVCERLLTEFTHTLSLSHQDFLILARDFRSYVIIILNCKIKEGRFSISQLGKILFKVELNELLTTSFGFTNLQSRFFSNFWSKSNFFDGEKKRH